MGRDLIDFSNGIAKTLVEKSEQSWLGLKVNHRPSKKYWILFCFRESNFVNTAAKNTTQNINQVTATFHEVSCLNQCLYLQKLLVFITESQHVFKSVLHFQPSFTINNFSKILVNSDGYLWGLVLQFLTASRKCGKLKISPPQSIDLSYKFRIEYF